jgi:hypothetical protein
MKSLGDKSQLFRELRGADFPKPLFDVSGMELSGFPETIELCFGNGAERISRNNLRTWYSLFDN